jgi:hypothetical protein
MRNIKILSLVLALAVTTPALAQKAGPNGGALYEKGEHGVEVVVGANDLAVYVLHDGKNSPTQGYALKAIAQQGGKSTAIALKDVEGKRFVGALAAPLDKGAIVVITGKDEHGSAVSVRHVVK